MKRLLKVLHTFGAIGTAGGYLAFLVLAELARARPPAAALVLREAIETLFSALVIPSLALVLMSGLLAIAAHSAFINARWAWLKLATTALALEGTFGMHARAREVTAMVRTSLGADVVASGSIGGRERGALAFLLFIAAANVVLGVFRPSLRGRARTSSETSRRT